MANEVRCVCGRLYHADPDHAGRLIRCRCGRAVAIPAAIQPSPPRKVKRVRHKQERSVRPPQRFPTLRWPRIALSQRIALIVWLIMWGYLGATVAAAIYLRLEGDRSWLATVFLFGPRWMLLLPAPLLALTALLVRPKFLLHIGAAVLVVLGPVMGFSLGWHRWLAPGGPRDLRLITFNVDGSENPLTPVIPASLARFEADLLIFQECTEAMAAPGEWPASWTARYDGGICLATRFRVDSTQVLERVLTGDQGGTGNVVLYRLTTPSGPLQLAAVHLETPRKGLEPLRGEGSVGSLELNILVRQSGSRRASRWIQAQMPGAIIAGDFNLPVESLIFRDSWDRCPDAFSAVGFGFGWTRVLKRFSARIDHVLTCPAWTPLRAKVGPDLGSDHLPLIVDLRRAR